MQVCFFSTTVVGGFVFGILLGSDQFSEYDEVVSIHSLKV